MTPILTLTMNPAVDVSTRAPQVEPVHKVRCDAAVVHPGGGGINVARVVHRLGGDVRALFPSGGRNGQLLCGLLEAEHIPVECVPIAGDTRESFSVHEGRSGLDWRFVLPGPTLDADEAGACADRVIAASAAAGPGVLVVASGSLPPGVSDEFYARLGQRLAGVGARLVVDSSGPALAAAVEAGVFLFKPSQRELRELTGAPLTDTAQRLAACRGLIARGRAALVALSLGAEGAMLVGREGAWQAPALSVPVASTIGAGDSFLAGLVLGLARAAPLEAAFRQAMAASAAALLAPGTALCLPQDVARLAPQVRVERLG